MEWVYVVLDHPPQYPSCQHTSRHYSSHPHRFIRQLHDHLIPESDTPTTTLKVKKKYHKQGIQSILQMLGCKHIRNITDDLFDYFATKYSSLLSEEITLTQHEFMQAFYASLEKFGTPRTDALVWDCTLAFRCKDRQQSMTLLLGGSSGCGKSTLASLIGSRLSISTVLSTDNIRHLLRHFYSKSDIPVLWTSSYYADTALDEAQLQSHQDPIIVGFEAQNEALFSKLDEIICYFEQRNESLILEGVHLSIEIIKRLMQRHPTCVPFLIYISNEKKHKERFAVRARYMTLEPRENKYVKYFDNIRTIHQFLVQKAIESKIPTIDNTNVDRALSLLYRTLFNTLATQLQHPAPLYDPSTHTTPVLSAAFQSAYQACKASERLAEQQWNVCPTQADPSETFAIDNLAPCTY